MQKLDIRKLNITKPECKCLFRVLAWELDSVGKGLHEWWEWWGTRQCNSAPNCFCQQETIKCWVVLQQYRTRVPWNTTWPREVPSLLFAKEVCIINDHKPLVAIISRDVATLWQHLQSIMLHIHLYRISIIYNRGSDLYIADWSSTNNHTENWDQEITGVNANMHAISPSVNIPIGIWIENIQVSTQHDADFQGIKFMHNTWLTPHTKRWSVTEHEAFLAN